ncbi:beta galactosidase jelly roll domain-containing protein [Bacillus sp. DX1.1]|uniref:beta-mannosidase n=1 Tax=unclassified Bacillus (in: firmicutes) TaxID=185979 RepID=UPI0025705BDA|nr:MULTISPECIES: glycoside hydrolase family 2 protein [unclassified Bacillus (in: firmicutes)]MDM5153119.1 beta galactosidase jelly roll domain-containing protein [Bacillus sp. DX1.1]WJE82090.1 beta galactosidase jelly roll domain-containing protein [Bacillus sp. DX3.1]
MKLHDNWKIRDFNVGEMRDLEIASPDFIDYFWITAKVPGDVHSTLIERNIIENPFFGHNDQKCRWVEEKVWWYRTTFEFQGNIHDGEMMELTFEGLDTYATVYLNGVELGSTENMFISHTFDVTRELKIGKNVLAVKFDPIQMRIKDKVQYYWSGFSKKRVWTRKAQSHFGWDWGPRLVCAGIWKDVHLKKRKYAKINNVFSRTTAIENNRATVQIDVEIATHTKTKEYETEIILAFGQNIIETQRVRFHNKKANITFHVDNPNLWWTHDIGTPNLYTLTTRLYADGDIVDEDSQDIGIRTIEVQRSNQSGDHCFTFVLNGVPLFAKGANWIPIDSFLASVPDSHYCHLIQMAKDANMNMLRVWGGGIYEKEVFYDECNKLGILIWQDFMFACALYPDYNKNFMENVYQEIVHVVKQLRNHPCLALWCGNNENDWLYEALKSSGEIQHPFYGEKIYHELMPELLEELDPTRLFWPSSPYGGNDHNSREQGDSHNWQVWHGNIEPRVFGEPQTVDYSIEGVSFKNFKKDTTTFASEFGMHASSNRYTLQKNIPDNQFFWGSNEMAYRNKDIHHPKGILLMEGYTGAPDNIEEYMNFSMLTQAEGLKYGIEHYRRNKLNTSGALVWQLNDCWPGTSWSVIDYYLLPKASYHYARKFFSPVLLTIDHESEQDIKIWVVNDTLKPYEDDVELSVYDFYGTKHFSRVCSVCVEPNVSAYITSISEQQALNGMDPQTSFIVIRSLRHELEENIYYFRDHKELALPSSNLSIMVDEEKQEISITSNTFARMVKIEMNMEQLVFTDNFFDLQPNTVKKVKVTQAQGKCIPWESLSVSAINSIK